MIIGFDAKRLIYNRTGLGNYSRTLVESLSQFYPESQYWLYSPGFEFNARISSLIKRQNITIKTPNNILSKVSGSYWRTFSLANRVEKDSVGIFHGLSNELPSGLGSKKTRGIVTIHDLIFFRYPELYSWVDRKIYAWKTREACRIAKKIVAVSKQTQDDLVELFGVDPGKVEVINQSCDPIFSLQVTEDRILSARERYQLPTTYVLYVGSIEERKNLLGLVKAIKILESKVKLHLVALGYGGSYLQKVRRFISESGLEERVKILSGVDFGDFPAIYQSASMLVYPSHFEGFGIPIIEALWSKIPVITSTGSCFAEAGGSASLYAEPGDDEALADAILRVLEDSSLRSEMIAKGYAHVQQFGTKSTAAKMMDLYIRVSRSS